MKNFEYANPTSVKEALGLLGNSWDDAQVLAGGTDILSLMKDYVVSPKRLVNIKNIKDLGKIGKSGGGWHIGATVTMDEIATNAQIRSAYPSLHEAAAGIASAQIRNMGTVGGDLCQRPRCWYFRGGHGLLAKGDNGQSLVPNGQNEYHAIFGAGPAYFVSASSLGPALIALGAKVNIASASGNHDVDADKFFVNPKDDSTREIALKPNEIVTGVTIPAPAGKNFTYEVRYREAVDWPVVTASVVLKMKGSSVDSASIVMGHVAPTPWRASQAEQMLAGKQVSESVAEEAGKAAVANATALSGNAHKIQLAKVAVKRAILAAAGVRA